MVLLSLITLRSVANDVGVKEATDAKVHAVTILCCVLLHCTRENRMEGVNLGL